ncbi:MAG: hypothetical protein AAF490_07555 [Chloroflexota bacterium]
MKTKKVSIELNETDYEALESISKTCGWSMSKVVAQCVKSGMPPSLNKVPEIFHDELLGLNKLDDRKLLDVLEGNHPSNKKETAAHKKANFGALRKTYALRLLRWRGHSIPLPYESMIG